MFCFLNGGIRHFILPDLVFTCNATDKGAHVCRAAVTNANAITHLTAHGVVDPAASVPEAPSVPAAWWSVRPPATPAPCHIGQ